MCMGKAQLLSDIKSQDEQRSNIFSMHLTNYIQGKDRICYVHFPLCIFIHIVHCQSLKEIYLNQHNTIFPSPVSTYCMLPTLIVPKVY